MTYYGIDARNLLAHYGQYGQTGTLIYVIGEQEHSMRGEFHLTDQGVIARKYRGRNTFHLCSLASVIGFTPKQVAA